MLEEIIETINKLDKIDEYIESLSESLSISDLKLSDLYHELEENKLDAIQSCKFVKEMQKVCINRRKIKEDLTISSAYKNNLSKLANRDYRKILIAELMKRKKQLKESYKKRIYTNEELIELGIKKGD